MTGVYGGLDLRHWSFQRILFWMIPTRHDPLQPTAAPPPAGGAGVLNYSNPSKTKACVPLAQILLGVPVILSIVSFGIMVKSTEDSGPCFPDFSESICYLGLSSAVILAWPPWAGFLAVSLIRRKLNPVWPIFMVILIAGIAWGGMLSTGLYQIASAYIDQTTRVHGAHWPVLEKVFKR